MASLINTPEKLDRQVLAAFLARSAISHSGNKAWIEASARDAEAMLGFERHRFADLLARASHAHHRYEQITDHADEKWADWYADYILTQTDIMEEENCDDVVAGAEAAVESRAAESGRSAAHRKPEALRAERDRLRTELAAAMKREGAIGSAAREVAWVLVPHLTREEELEFPAVAVLSDLAKRNHHAEMPDFERIIGRLQSEREYLAAEHQVIHLSLGGLAAAACQSGDQDSVDLAYRLAAHAKMEETLIYPAAILAALWSTRRQTTRDGSVNTGFPTLQPGTDFDLSEESIETASRDSFPASDPPSWTHVTVGGPVDGAGKTQASKRSATIAIPESLKTEHEELHRELAAATKVSGAVGNAARAVAKLLHPHFVDEEAFALPPLGVLGAFVRGEQVVEPAPLIAMAARLKAELPRMLEEHRTITAALRKLEAAAVGVGDKVRQRLALKIIAHARIEEEVMYPAAILVGEYLKHLARMRPGGSRRA